MSKKRAFVQIYEIYRGPITGFIYSRTRNWMAAEDIAADVFVIAWEQRDRLLDPAWNEPRYHHGFLRAIARNLVARYQYQQRRRGPVTFAEYFAVVPEDEDLTLADDGGIEAIISACDTAMAVALLAAALAACTPTQLQIIEMRYAQNLPDRDVAARLGLTRRAYSERHGVLMQHLAMRLGLAPQDKRKAAGDA